MLARGATPNVGLSMGSHTLTLTVTDPYGASATDTVVVNTVHAKDASGNTTTATTSVTVPKSSP